MKAIYGVPEYLMLKVTNWSSLTVRVHVQLSSATPVCLLNCLTPSLRQGDYVSFAASMHSHDLDGVVPGMVDLTLDAWGDEIVLAAIWRMRTH